VTFEDLEFFWALAERQSITEAGKAVSISQPTASRRLKAMEEELGGQLVDRNAYPLSLTPFGFLLLDFADDVLKRYHALMLRRDQDHSVIGRLTIATSSSPAARLVTRMVADFITAQPGVHVELWEMNSREVEQRIAAGDAPVGFMGVPAQIPEIATLPVAEDEIVLLIPHHPLFSQLRRTVQWEAVQPLPFVVRRVGSGTQATISRALAKRGWAEPRHVVLEVDTAAAMIDAVESGLGAGFVSRELLFRRELRHATPVAVRGLSISRPFYLAYHPDRIRLAPIASEFLRLARLQAREPAES
jgi:DNA-binding transcriptional LysR family regulator